MTCQKIISGGQTGIDRGALDACLKNQFICGGWCPKGRLAEDGTIDAKYPLKETRDCNYDTRTLLNVKDADGTLIISRTPLSGGTLLTRRFAEELERPYLIISLKKNETFNCVSEIFSWLVNNRISVLNVAGPRDSEWKKGYRISYTIISNLIENIRNQ